MTILELCKGMEGLGASDLFFSEGKQPAMRVSGTVKLVPDAPVLAKEDLLDFIDRQFPQGTLDALVKEKDLDLGADIGIGNRIRVNLSYRRGFMAMDVRRVSSGELQPSLLGIPETILQFADNPRGLILITGATSSGKSTTLACMLDYINSNMRKHIVTIEDPIEFVHDDKLSVISQREVQSDTKDFATALKHVVRQNPDVIFIGEIRDAETISTAISASMTGHLVAATMHTQDTSQTIERIFGFFQEEQRQQVALDLSYTLKAVIAQRLLPKANGNGRAPAFEILVNTPLVQRMIANRNIGSLYDVIKASKQDGMCSFCQSIFNLCNEGIVDMETALRFATDRDELALLFKGMETGVDMFRNYSSDPDNGLSIKKLLGDALHYGASDLILTTGSPPVVRIDGMLRAFDMPTLTAGDTRKLLYSVLNSAQKAVFEERHELDFALAVRGITNDKNEEFRFRVNGFHQRGSVAAAMRVIPSKLPDASKLGLPQSVLKLAQLRQGLVLVTGPTGSGKSTTLAALLDIVNRTRPCHIITVEDPIEFVHPHKMAIVEQREINADTLSFANALKYVLRQDPDVILVGEMRDLETIETALTAAETGHLVFATLHTNDVTQCVDRIVDVFPANRQNQVRMQVAATLEAVISQRLLPRNGQPGRVAVFEVLIGTTAVRAMIREQKTHQLLGAMETSQKDGMITMDRALMNLLNAGLISRDTFLSMQPHFSADNIQSKFPNYAK
ncbi:MAG: PilT/PilU family type 4a pilus ATPase [Victivallales bacterium]|nr:PilT/PilU family type 4a pilus ATPase [Victivallales bacterium]